MVLKKKQEIIRNNDNQGQARNNRRKLGKIMKEVNQMKEGPSALVG